MVVNCDLKLYFHNLKDMRPKPEGEDIKEKMANIRRQALGFGLEEVAENVFDFNLINIKQYFNDSNTKSGMKIMNVTDSDLRMAEKNEKRRNVI